MLNEKRTTFNLLKGLDFDGWAIPPHTQLTLRNYFFYGLPPGGFVEFMLMHADNIKIEEGYEYNLALNRADNLNKMSILTIARFIREKLPPESWGDYENIKNWMMYK